MWLLFATILGEWGCTLPSDRPLAADAADDVARAMAAARPACAAVWSAPLGDVDAWTAAGGEPPETAIALSPDGQRVAVGTLLGDVSVFATADGNLLVRRSFPDSVVREVAWALDARTLWIGEQATVARIRTLDAATLKEVRRVEFEADVGRSPPPTRDVYAMYALPGVFGLRVLNDGSVVAALNHGWSDDGSHRNRSRLVRLSAEGAREAAWPADGAADATLLFPVVAGDSVVVPVGRSADGPPPAEPPIDALVVLNVKDLKVRRTVPSQPLRPWYERVFTWRALALDPSTETIFAGFGDGRVRSWSLATGAAVTKLDIGVPTHVGAVPIAASIGFGEAVNGGFAFITSETSIPYGAADPSARPPRTHPNANTLWWMTPEGKVGFSWTGPPRLDGLAVSSDGAWLAVGAGLRETDDRQDLFGILRFASASGLLSHEAFCAAPAPAFHRFAVRTDGAVAFATHPFRSKKGVEGEYRLWWMR